MMIKEIIAGYAGKDVQMPWIQQVIVENTSTLTTIAQVVGIIAASMAILGGLWAAYRYIKKNYSIKKRT